ncbi:MAG: Zn-ribbon domain-containing OB-fold protein [Variovorax sp.]
MTQLTIVPTRGRRAYPPRVSAFTQPFWEGLVQGKWQTTCCDACGRQTFPPRLACPHCWSDQVRWSPLSARGTLYSWTRIHAAPAVFAAESPYAVGIVDLDSGVRLACRLLEAGPADWKPGMAVEMAVLQYEDGPLFAARALPID